MSAYSNFVKNFISIKGSKLEINKNHVRSWGLCLSLFQFFIENIDFWTGVILDRILIFVYIYICFKTALFEFKCEKNASSSQKLINCVSSSDARVSVQ